ncbi:MAG TPA: hypothetical protein VHA14_03140 [Bryobacteraceae bacterium]|nr:hypothetical protein [Bryobacteraceae bacterium]
MTEVEALIQALNQHGVEYIVVGGVAALAHGSVRLTQDLDIVYRRSPQNLDRIVAALRDLKPYLRGAPPGLPFVWDRATLVHGLNFTLETNLGWIDLLGEIPGGGRYEDLVSESVELQMFSGVSKCLNLEQLIRAKRAAGRPKDLEALAELEALREETGSTS